MSLAKKCEIFNVFLDAYYMNISNDDVYFLFITGQIPELEQ